MKKAALMGMIAGIDNFGEGNMTQKNFSLIAGIIFAIVALVHLLRIAQGWDIAIAGMLIPMWISWAGFFVTAILAYFGLRFGTHGS